MAAKKYYLFLALFLIVILCVNLASVQLVRADDGTPTEPPVPVPTQVETEAPVEQPPAEATSSPQEAPPTAETTEVSPSPAPVVEESTPTPFPSALDSTDIVVLDEQGQPVALGSQASAGALMGSDPVWCPESVSVPTPGANGCSVSYPSIADLLAAMQANPQSFSQNGTIFLEKTDGQGFTDPLTLDDSSKSLGSSFKSLSLYNLTIQGGWDPATGRTADQTVFSGSNAYVQVGSSTNPWNGSLSINNVTVTGSGVGQDAIRIFGSNVVLTNVTASYSDMNGISITANNLGTVALNNVTASHNGHMGASGPVGSGVYINGSNTLVNVAGGFFNDNARYGIEAQNSTSTTLPVANLWTDQQDYAPGSIVTISGNDNSLNGSNVGFLSGETVRVYVQGPNGYTATCEAVANSYGGWSCQIALWASDLAVGNYIYFATGLTSGVSAGGFFTDGRTINSVTLNGGSTVTVGPGGTISVIVNVTTTGNGSNAQWRSTAWRVGNSGPFTCVNHANHDTAGTYSETLTITAPATPGTYNITITAYQDDACNAGGSSTTMNNAVTVTSPTSTPTNTPVNTATATSTRTPTTAPTNTLTRTPTNTVTATSTRTPTNAPTNTPTRTPTKTSTPTRTPTNGPTNTPTKTATSGPTNIPSNTPTKTPTNAATAVPTNTPIHTPTGAPVASPTSSSSQPSAQQQGSTASSGFVIPLTGGQLIKLDCNTVLSEFGIKFTFFNLCDQQAAIHSVGSKELPAQLPVGYSYVRGVRIDILTDGQTLKDLPGESGIEMDFPLSNQSGDQYAVLYWHDDGNGKGEWVEISKALNTNQISTALSTGDDLYHLLNQAGSQFLYQTLTTDKTGIFILVKK